MLRLSDSFPPDAQRRCRCMASHSVSSKVKILSIKPTLDYQISVAYQISIALGTYTPIRYKRDDLLHYFSLMKSLENAFYFFTCIFPDFVTHESSKVF